MNKGKKLYEGKAKILYEGPEKGTAIQHFKDDATAFNNQKKSTVEGKGVLNNRISEHILNNLNQIGIKTHLLKTIYNKFLGSVTRNYEDVNINI